MPKSHELAQIIKIVQYMKGNDKEPVQSNSASIPDNK